MSSKEVGIEDARKTLGDLANEVRYTGASVILTRNGKPVARIAPLEPPMAVTVGTRVTVPEYSVPEDWARKGEIIEATDEAVVVELDDGHKQELPRDEVKAV
ncbi:type II toxin-antitoxin system prevent-host-death family antitoxin [Streptomyces sp. 4R-3d]|uniref:type II toxin-antitoxin system prevent-host-death family antitoxin n=1 Tax=Streptomyces sp. 4R-3d TaxID=2559605 RepID=UPI00107173B2|nr:type II toxin-antitoxin system prevent-host-death family antitoxin [Streptomyces sp. 4R-3d]TFI30180.1 type II toxin-antitoxin system prevent-host-death family antitoxin [Streptomyces sp. 4R-3d]